jgi:hypothetical protein
VIGFSFSYNKDPLNSTLTLRYPRLGNGKPPNKENNEGKTRTGVDPTIVVAIIAGSITLLTTSVAAGGGILDRFFSPVVEVIVAKHQIDPNDALFVSYMEGAIAAVERNDLKTAISQRDLAKKVLDDMNANTQGEDKKVWNLIARVTNYGSQPATNLSLSLSAPATNSFSAITNEFSTTDIGVRNFINSSQREKPLQVDETISISELNTRPTYVEVHTPKLTHGTGSRIELGLVVPNEPDLSRFVASAVYDQGSAASIPAGKLTYKGFMDNFTKASVFIILIWIGLVGASEYVLHQGEKRGWFKKGTDFATRTLWRIIRAIFYVAVAGILWGVFSIFA